MTDYAASLPLISNFSSVITIYCRGCVRCHIVKHNEEDNL